MTHISPCHPTFKRHVQIGGRPCGQPLVGLCNVRPSESVILRQLDRISVTHWSRWACHGEIHGGVRFPNRDTSCFSNDSCKGRYDGSRPFGCLLALATSCCELGLDLFKHLISLILQFSRFVGPFHQRLDRGILTGLKLTPGHRIGIQLDVRSDLRDHILFQLVEPIHRYFNVAIDLSGLLKDVAW